MGQKPNREREVTEGLGEMNPKNKNKVLCMVRTG